MPSQIQEFDPQRVRPLPGQPRKRFKGLKALADSIFEVGQKSPGLVTLVTDDPDFDAQLVDGERRLRACKMVKVKFRAEVTADGDPEEIFATSFAANFGKQDHDAIEIAEGLARLQKAGKTIEQLGRIAGKSNCWVSQHLSLLKLHPDVQAMMIVPDDADDEAPRLSFSLALLLVPLEPDAQVTLANRITKGEGMGLSEARRFILKMRAKAGDKRAYAGRGRTLGSIETQINEFAERLGIYVDMPGAELNAMIDASDNTAKVQLIETMEDLQASLGGLQEAIERRLEKSRQVRHTNAF